MAKKFAQKSGSSGVWFGQIVMALGLFMPVLFADIIQAAPQPEVFFVATNGNDSWSGRLPRPDVSGKDGPLRTVAYALSRVRHIRCSSGAETKPIIYLRDGLYLLEEPITVEPKDSGLTIANFAGERPVISGGARVVDWSETNISGIGRVFVAPLPPGATADYKELWMNGLRATRARHPNHGYFQIAAVPDTAKVWSEGQNRFGYTTGDVPDWPGLTNAEVLAFTRWVESRLPILRNDTTNRLLEFSKKSVFELSPGDRFYIEGAMEALDTPGEWCIDARARKIYYMPRAGEEPSACMAILPRLSQLLVTHSGSGAASSIHNLTLRGITFSHSEWALPRAAGKAEPSGFSQAAIGVPAAVSLAHAASWRIESCRFQSLGGYALELGQGCQSNLVAACEFSDLGAGGIKIGETSIRRHRAGQAFGNTVMNCTLRDGGKLFASAVGIWIGQSFSNKLLRNTIRDFYYTGISIGWSWGYGQALASNNLIAFNRVGYIGEKSDHDGPVLSDMGGIYTLGRQPGTRILNNVFHDISGIRYGGWGIYLDEGSSGIIVQSNIVCRTTHGGFHQHYGETNRIENNIFALGRDQQLQLSVAEAHQSLRFRHNIVYFNHGALLAGAWRKAQVDMDENLYYDTRGSNAFDFAGLPFEKWRQLGRDEHSLIADPQFANPANENFTPAAGSPAGRIGFQEITAPAGNTKKSEQHLPR